MVPIRRALSLTLVLMACWSLGRLPCHADEPPPALAVKLAPLLKPLALDPANKDDLTRLLTERHNAAVAFLDERLKQYKRGVRDLSAVYEGARLVVQAKLALAATPEATVRTLEDALEITRLIETYAKDLVEKKVGTPAEVELARYNRLGIEIELLRAKQKVPMK